jgi:AraC family transcriptional regulator
MTDAGRVAKAGWSPLVYFWDGGWIGAGVSVGMVPQHSHHAVQIALGLDGPIRLRHEEGEWMESGGGIVVPNAPHSFDGTGSHIAMIFVDPESREGRWLAHSCRTPVQMVPAERYASHLPALLDFGSRRPSAEEASTLLGAIVHSLCEGPPPLRKMDERIAKALAFMRDRDARGLTLDAVAKEVFLSSGRFAHLFTEEVGLPFRRYLLWRKVNRAIDAFGRGENLSNAAHTAGFADSAHLTRTFHQMFGIPPTVMMGTATFYEIPAPFEIMRPDVQ